MSERRTDPLAVTGFVADTISFSNVDGPGNRFVVFLQGCNFDCVACHNPQTIPIAQGDHFRTSVADVVAKIRQAEPFISGITVSGGEATLQLDFVEALFTAVRTDPKLSRLSCFIDSNGSLDDAGWQRILPLTDGAMIDLKCFDDEIHRSMTGESNDTVRHSIELLATRGLLYEVRLLILHGVNDGSALLRRTGEWLASLDPMMRVKIIGFRAHGVRPHDPPLVEPTVGELTTAAANLQVAALNLCIV